MFYALGYIYKSPNKIYFLNRLFLAIALYNLKKSGYKIIKSILGITLFFIVHSYGTKYNYM